MVLYGAEGLIHRSHAQALLALAAAECWGMEVLPPMERGPWGKPFFPGLEHRQFNLSHSGSLALAALDSAPVGVDIQIVRPRRPAFPAKVFSPEELAWRDEGEDHWGRFAQLWALKECRVKESGRGLTRPISAIRVPLPQGEGPCLLDGLWFQTYSGAGWRAALCGRTPPPVDIQWRTLPPARDGRTTGKDG